MDETKMLAEQYKTLSSELEEQMQVGLLFFFFFLVSATKVFSSKCTKRFKLLWSKLTGTFVRLTRPQPC